MNMVKVGVPHLLIGIFQTWDILYLDLKTQDVRHVLNFIYIFIQQLMQKHIFNPSKTKKPTLIANQII